MKIGITLHATDETIDVAEIAREAESRGFYSLYIPEHTHIPTSRRTPAPSGTPELGREYYRTPDPYVMCGAAAAVTAKIRLGTGIALVAQHDPIALAKTIATVDWASGGRFVLGIGFGWNHEEMENHGIDVARRRERVRDVMLAMQELWSHEVAEYHGEFVSFEPSFQWPKPIQQPRVRSLLGGAPGPKMFAHVAEYCDGWIPIGGAGIRAALVDLRREWEARGRDWSTAHIVPFGVLPDEGKLEYYREIGCTEVVLRVATAARDEVMRDLDAFTRYAQQWNTTDGM
jgi:probable F420-dependent oxidoreductase